MLQLQIFIIFWIKVIIKGENRNSRPVGQITKISCESCCCDFLTKSDSYRIQFPSYATPVEKMMIIIGSANR